MVISLGRSAVSADPHIRQMDPRRDGVALADLLETAFKDEPADEDGLAVLRMLRNFGVFDVSMTDGATGFLWVEDGRLAGNASLMRNSTRPDTWVIGNVGTHPAFRGRGIATRLVTACMRYSESRGGKHAALQVAAGNASALRVYERLGFSALGKVTHYARPSLRAAPADSPFPALTGLPTSTPPRLARWNDRHFVWSVSRRNIPEALAWAEAFSRSDYWIGFKWWLMNQFEGNPVEWLVLDGRGAVRARASAEASRHQIDLMPAETASVSDVLALLGAAMARFEGRASRPILAAQSRIGDAGSEAAHAALLVMGFKTVRTLTHMRALLGAAA